MSRDRDQHHNKGFTIIELMIALAVLSTILTIVTVVMINIGNLYYKGINQARVQDAVRNVTDDISRQLQLSNGFTAAAPINRGAFTINAYCMGNTRYSYVTGTQIGQGDEPDGGPPRINHVLWRDTNSSGGCTPLDLTQADPSNGVSGSTNGAELMPPNSRLPYFSINGTSPYDIDIQVAYGDYDLLTGVTGSPGSPVRCKGDTGDQFCATAYLHTIVVRRL